jgi:hypothetical protein
MKFPLGTLLLALWPTTSAIAASDTPPKLVQTFAERLKAQKNLRQEAKQEQADDHENELSEHHSKFQKRIIEVIVMK